MGAPAIKMCHFCNKLFQSMGGNVCPSCMNQIDKDFLKVREYIYDAPPGVSVQDIIDNTDVPEKTVLYLLKEGYISHRDGISGGNLKCAACGATITSGRLCSKCSQAWLSDTGNADEKKEKPGDSQSKSSNSKKMHTFG
jgi:predicted amidophosphoribosyltransferase